MCVYNIIIVSVAWSNLSPISTHDRLILLFILFNIPSLLRFFVTSSHAIWTRGVIFFIMYNFMGDVFSVCVCVCVLIKVRGFRYTWSVLLLNEFLLFSCEEISGIKIGIIGRITFELKWIWLFWIRVFYEKL